MLGSDVIGYYNAFGAGSWHQTTNASEKIGSFPWRLLFLG